MKRKFLASLLSLVLLGSLLPATAFGAGFSQLSEFSSPATKLIAESSGVALLCESENSDYTDYRLEIWVYKKKLNGYSPAAGMLFNNTYLVTSNPNSNNVYYLIKKGNGNEKNTVRVSSGFSGSGVICDSALSDAAVECMPDYGYDTGYGDYLIHQNDTAFIVKNDTSYGLYDWGRRNNEEFYDLIADLPISVDDEIVFAYGYNKKITFISKSADGSEYQVFTYENGSWEQKSVISCSDIQINPNCAVGYKNKIFFYGDNTLSENNTFMFDITRKEWKPLDGNMPEAAINSITCKDDILYLAQSDGTKTYLYEMPVPAELQGDIDRNSAVTASDAALILQYVLDNEGTALDREQLELGALSGNQEIIAADAAQILNIALNN